MSIRGSLTIECDQPKCHAEIVLEARDFTLGPAPRGTDVGVFAYGWHVNDDEQFICPQCAAPDERDEAYERAAARARNNDFADTSGKDWT